MWAPQCSSDDTRSLNEEGNLTKDFQRKIARIALERMEQEWKTDFARLAQFRTSIVGRFLAWIATVEKPRRLEAALSVTCHQLKLCHIQGEYVPNYERWANSYSASPLDLGLDRTWRPRSHARCITTLVHSGLGPLRSSKQSPDLTDDNPLSTPEIRTGLELNTRVADIVLLQFLREDKSLFDLSYVSVLGLGPTGWRVHDEADCAKAVAQLPVIIAKANELV